MPYIRKEEREFLDEEINALIKKLNSKMSAGGNYQPGLLNYAITRILLGTEFDGGIRYARINEICGILECVKLEMYRKKASPYEDDKESENGKVE